MLIERTLTSRLGIRILAEHHIGLRNERVCRIDLLENSIILSLVDDFALHNEVFVANLALYMSSIVFLFPQENYFGIVCTQMSLKSLIERCTYFCR